MEDSDQVFGNLLDEVMGKEDQSTTYERQSRGGGRGKHIPHQKIEEDAADEGGGPGKEGVCHIPPGRNGRFTAHGREEMKASGVGPCSADEGKSATIEGKPW
jgi:hypothetical protein